MMTVDSEQPPPVPPPDPCSLPDGRAPKVNFPILAVGLVVPGGSSLARGRPGDALLTAWTVGFFAATTVVGLVARNDTGFPAPMQIVRALGTLPWPPLVTPTVAVCAAFAVAIHVGSAWLAAREFDKS